MAAKLAVLLLCDVLDSLPAPSYIPLSTGTTVMVSLPLAIPERPMPNVYTLLLADILVGVALERVAAPPLILKAKSFACKAPLPPFVLYTASLIVTAILALSLLSATDEIVGTVLS